MTYCYFNGACIDEKNANLSIHTLGVQRGFGVFDLFRSRRGTPTFIEDHLARFEKSQEFLNLDRFIKREEIMDAVIELQRLNQFGDATFKLMLLAQGSEMEEQLKPLFYIIHSQLDVGAMPKTGTLISYEYVREYPEIKSVNYFTSNLLHQKKKASNAIDVLYHHRGVISETSRSNVFVVKNGRVLVPERNVLAGITRKHILEIAKADFQVETRDVRLDELMSADEVFISSTLKEVMPITAVDGKKIGNGKSGPISIELLKRFHDFLKD